MGIWFESICFFELDFQRVSGFNHWNNSVVSSYQRQASIQVKTIFFYHICFHYSSDSADLIKKTMTGSCISSGSIPITNKLPSVLATNQHLARPHSLTASHSESRIQKPTRARSNVRLNTSKETRGNCLKMVKLETSFRVSIDAKSKGSKRRIQPYRL